MGLFNKKKEEPKFCSCGGTGASEHTAEAPKAAAGKAFGPGAAPP